MFLFLFVLFLIPCMFEYFYNQYVYIEIQYYKYKNRLYAMRRYDRKCHIWRSNNGFTTDEFKKFVEYDARHPLLSSIKYLFIMYDKELPKCKDVDYFHYKRLFKEGHCVLLKT